LDSEHPLLTDILSRLRPETVADIKARIETAITEQFGAAPEPEAVARFLEDIRLAQAMSGIDMDYASHYSEMHKVGVDFMSLAQAVKAADKSLH